MASGTTEKGGAAERPSRPPSASGVSLNLRSRRLGSAATEAAAGARSSSHAALGRAAGRCDSSPDGSQLKAGGGAPAQRAPSQDDTGRKERGKKVTRLLARKLHGAPGEAAHKRTYSATPASTCEGHLLVAASLLSEAAAQTADASSRASGVDGAASRGREDDARAKKSGAPEAMAKPEDRSEASRAGRGEGEGRKPEAKGDDRREKKAGLAGAGTQEERRKAKSHASEEPQIEALPRATTASPSAPSKASPTAAAGEEKASASRLASGKSPGSEHSDKALPPPRGGGSELNGKTRASARREGAESSKAGGGEVGSSERGKPERNDSEGGAGLGSYSGSSPPATSGGRSCGDREAITSLAAAFEEKERDKAAAYSDFALTYAGRSLASQGEVPEELPAEDPPGLFLLNDSVSRAESPRLQQRPMKPSRNAPLASSAPGVLSGVSPADLGLLLDCLVVGEQAARRAHLRLDAVAREVETAYSTVARAGLRLASLLGVPYDQLSEFSAAELMQASVAGRGAGGTEAGSRAPTTATAGAYRGRGGVEIGEGDDGAWAAFAADRDWEAVERWRRGRGPRGAELGLAEEMRALETAGALPRGRDVESEDGRPLRRFLASSHSSRPASGWADGFRRGAAPGVGNEQCMDFAAEAGGKATRADGDEDGRAETSNSARLLFEFAESLWSECVKSGGKKGDGDADSRRWRSLEALELLRTLDREKGQRRSSSPGLGSPYVGTQQAAPGEENGFEAMPSRKAASFSFPVPQFADSRGVWPSETGAVNSERCGDATTQAGQTCSSSGLSRLRSGAGDSGRTQTPGGLRGDGEDERGLLFTEEAEAARQKRLRSGGASSTSGSTSRFGNWRELTGSFSGADKVTDREAAGAPAAREAKKGATMEKEGQNLKAGDSAGGGQPSREKRLRKETSGSTEDARATDDAAGVSERKRKLASESEPSSEKNADADGVAQERGEEAAARAPGASNASADAKGSKATRGAETERASGTSPSSPAPQSGGILTRGRAAASRQQQKDGEESKDAAEAEPKSRRGPWTRGEGGGAERGKADDAGDALSGGIEEFLHAVRARADREQRSQSEESSLPPYKRHRVSPTAAGAREERARGTNSGSRDDKGGDDEGGAAEAAEATVGADAHRKKDGSPETPEGGVASPRDTHPSSEGAAGPGRADEEDGDPGERSDALSLDARQRNGATSRLRWLSDVRGADSLASLPQRDRLPFWGAAGAGGRDRVDFDWRRLSEAGSPPYTDDEKAFWLSSRLGRLLSSSRGEGSNGSRSSLPRVADDGDDEGVGSMCHLAGAFKLGAGGRLFSGSADASAACGEGLQPRRRRPNERIKKAGLGGGSGAAGGLALRRKDEKEEPGEEFTTLSSVYNLSGAFSPRDTTASAHKLGAALCKKNTSASNDFAHLPPDFFMDPASQLRASEGGGGVGSGSAFGGRGHSESSRAFFRGNGDGRGASGRGEAPACQGSGGGFSGGAMGGGDVPFAFGKASDPLSSLGPLGASQGWAAFGASSTNRGGAASRGAPPFSQKSGRLLGSGGASGLQGAAPLPSPFDPLGAGQRGGGAGRHGSLGRAGCSPDELDDGAFFAETAFPSRAGGAGPLGCPPFPFESTGHVSSPACRGDPLLSGGGGGYSEHFSSLVAGAGDKGARNFPPSSGAMEDAATHLFSAAARGSGAGGRRPSSRDSEDEGTSSDGDLPESAKTTWPGATGAASTFGSRLHCVVPVGSARKHRAPGDAGDPSADGAREGKDYVSEVPGVSYRSTPHSGWRFRWKDAETGKEYSRCFSVNKFGFERAKRKAERVAREMRQGRSIIISNHTRTKVYLADSNGGASSGGSGGGGGAGGEGSAAASSSSFGCRPAVDSVFPGFPFTSSSTFAADCGGVSRSPPPGSALDASPFASDLSVAPPSAADGPSGAPLASPSLPASSAAGRAGGGGGSLAMSPVGGDFAAAPSSSLLYFASSSSGFSTSAGGTSGSGEGCFPAGIGAGASASFAPQDFCGGGEGGAGAGSGSATPGSFVLGAAGGEFCGRPRGEPKGGLAEGLGAIAAERPHMPFSTGPFGASTPLEGDNLMFQEPMQSAVGRGGADAGGGSSADRAEGDRETGALSSSVRGVIFEHARGSWRGLVVDKDTGRQQVRRFSARKYGHTEARLRAERFCLEAQRLREAREATSGYSSCVQKDGGGVKTNAMFDGDLFSRLDPPIMEESMASVDVAGGESEERPWSGSARGAAGVSSGLGLSRFSPGSASPPSYLDLESSHALLAAAPLSSIPDDLSHDLADGVGGAEGPAGAASAARRRNGRDKEAIEFAGRAGGLGSSGEGKAPVERKESGGRTEKQAGFSATRKDKRAERGGGDVLAPQQRTLSSDDMLGTSKADNEWSTGDARGREEEENAGANPRGAAGKEGTISAAGTATAGGSSRSA
ncbi:hypothetical protein BESB_072400 [Besnoitia besnoiti]|uniref:Uncharacterized protein n=1 Tax=Besnoitia besnoiti TaxID=94643 RepID=A0A2A9M6I8_BESBE|nr:uncharacterized protein BESB_072400 [Besnoitia besnoiti]PFH34088.1 hypothetical protein BESB_072400 [Besnoitia besnoiti]